MFIARTFCIMKSAGTLQKRILFYLLINKMFRKLKNHQMSPRNVTAQTRERDLLK